MKNVNLTGLKGWFCYSLLFFLMIRPLGAEILPGSNTDSDEPPVTVAEMRYEKLMKTYINQIKMAFSEAEDRRSLEILTQFFPEFSHKTDGIKKELQLQLKQLTPRQKELLINRFRERSHNSELIALLFDERVTSRTAANSNLKTIMEQLHAKSLEVQKTGQEFLAAD